MAAEGDEFEYIGEDELPSGAIFCPTDKMLIEQYLVKKIEGKELPSQAIKPVNLYQSHPEELYQQYTNGGDPNMEARYFFTPRDRKYPNGSRPNRSARQGYWKATGSDKPIAAGSVGGSKKTLVFYQGEQRKGIKTRWMMHEYRIPGKEKPVDRENRNMMLDDWVLCKIFHKGRVKAAKKEEVEESESVEQLQQQVDHEISLQQQLEQPNQLGSNLPIACHQPNPLGDNFITSQSCSVGSQQPPTDFFMDLGMLPFGEPLNLNGYMQVSPLQEIFNVNNHMPQLNPTSDFKVDAVNGDQLMVDRGNSQDLSMVDQGNSPYLSPSMVDQGNSQYPSMIHQGNSQYPSVVDQGNSPYLSSSMVDQSNSQYPSTIHQGNSQYPSVVDQGNSPYLSSSMVDQSNSQYPSTIHQGNSQYPSVVDQGNSPYLSSSMVDQSNSQNPSMIHQGNSQYPLMVDPWMFNQGNSQYPLMVDPWMDNQGNSQQPSMVDQSKSQYFQEEHLNGFQHGGMQRERTVQLPPPCDPIWKMTNSLNSIFILPSGADFTYTNTLPSQADLPTSKRRRM